MGIESSVSGSAWPMLREGWMRRRACSLLARGEVDSGGSTDGSIEVGGLLWNPHVVVEMGALIPADHRPSWDVLRRHKDVFFTIPPLGFPVLIPSPILLLLGRHGKSLSFAPTNFFTIEITRFVYGFAFWSALLIRIAFL
jgi:hypothetical protein